MLLIAALTIIAFAFLYNTTEMNRVGSNTVAKIYGRTVMQVDVERALRNYQLSLALGQFDLVRHLAGAAKTEDEAANNFIWNLMVLQHEAKALDIEPGEQEVVARIKSLPVFQQDGRFDPVKYSDFVQQQLAPRGFSERQLEDVIRDSLRLEGIKALVELPAMVLPGDIEPVLARMTPMDVELVEFDSTVAAEAVAVSDEELQKAFDERRGSLQVPEMRSLRYVTFSIPEDAAAKGGKDRIGALQKVASATSDFAQALADSGAGMADFGAKKQMEAHVTPLFDAKGVPDGKVSGHDAEVIEAAKEVAFRLHPQAGSYEIVELGDKGYAVIEVVEVKAPRPQEFDEARADLRAELIAQKRNHAIVEKASKVLPGLRAKLAAGEPLAKAAEAEGLKVQEMKGLNLFDQGLTPDEREIAIAAADLPEGKLGDLQGRTGGGGFAVYVAKRSEPDAKELAERRPMIEQGALEGKKMLMFAQWLADARRQSDLRVLRPAM